MPRSVLALLVTAALLGAGAYVLLGTDDAAPEDVQASVAVSDALGSSDTTGYRRATAPRAFSFPADHGPHPGFKTEWWYVTGTLDTESGRTVGYQWTIFRTALTPPDETPIRFASTDSAAAPQASASWATNQFYLGHFAVSDVANRQHYDAERVSRGGAGLAGAQAEPFRVWLEDWSMQSVGAETTGGGPAASAIFPARLQARQDGIAIDVTLRPEKPLVLQGDRGLSQKGPGTGNASYYYSFTRLATDGTVVVEDDTLQVTGQSWMDREWSTSALGPDQVGWDWFSLQLSDGRDLMYYQLRNADGTPSRFSEGVIVGPDGDARPIAREDVRLEVLDTWTAPGSGRTYPVRWRLHVPDADLHLTITPYFEDQEMATSVRYWEGAVRAEGATDGGDAPAATGRGYVELTGYGDAPALTAGSSR
jgi:predicted secreted hydrolase